MRRLLIRPGALGDFVVSLPALAFLQSDYTEVWTSRENVPLLRWPDRVRALPDTGLDLLGIPMIEPPSSLLRELRTFDEVVSWYGAGRPEFRSALGGLEPAVRFYPALPTGDRHAADFYAAQVGAPVCAVPRIPCPSRLREGIVIQPFASRLDKRWPLERFRHVAAALNTSVPVSWCAGPEEPLVGAARFENRYELACWLAGAKLFLGNDSGVSHLAAAVGTPTVALFGPTDPGTWAPRGPHVTVLQATGGNLAALSTEAVLGALQMLL